MPLTFPPKAMVSLGVLTIAIAACSPGGGSIPVSTTHPVRQDLTSWISSNGKVEPIEPHVIQSQLTTFILKVSVGPGQAVKRGQILMTLDSKDLESELARLKGELITAEDEAKIAAAGGSPEELAQLQSEL